MRKLRKGKEKTFSADDFAWELADHLLEDFRPFVNNAWYEAVAPLIKERNVHAMRALTTDTLDGLSIIEFKCRYQILDLFKKFSFSIDAKTPTEVLEESKEKFLANQKRLDSFSIEESPLIRDILWRAKGHIEGILGDYSQIDVLKRAAFGKKSSVGVSMRNACEGARLEAPISGSSDQQIWFEHLYGCWNRPAFNYAKSRAVNRNVPLFKTVDTLEAVLVDKTWKSKRLIMPNTTIGTLYSKGLGRLLEDLLRKAGFDIKALQPVHGELAKIGSITGSLVTADQSMASDNIVTELIDRTFPRQWASALKLGRIEDVKFYDTVLKSKTFCTMGIGFTFPLQCLVFLGLLFAIRDYAGLDKTSVVSVFGDDLIYDHSMHDLVLEVFPKLGLVINVEKTFADGFFRESCGHDFYHGIDVRPYHLAGAVGSDVAIRSTEAYLYKVANGLRRRWSDTEIPSTLSFVLKATMDIREGKPLLVVPDDFPDTAGVKAPLDNLKEHVHFARNYRSRHGLTLFRCLAFEAKQREESRHAPYMWLALRREPQIDMLAMKALEAINKHHRGTPIFEDSIPIFRDADDVDRGSVRSLLTGRRLRPIVTTIPEQDRGRYRERACATSRWQLAIDRE